VKQCDGNVGQPTDRARPDYRRGTTRSRSNDQNSIHGSHQGLRSTTAPTGRTHDRKVPPIALTRDKTLASGGPSTHEDGKPVLFSGVSGDADRQRRQLNGVLIGLGMTADTEVTILSDGADGPRSLGEAASTGTVYHVLDWFHLAMHGQTRRALCLIQRTLAALKTQVAGQTAAARSAAKLAKVLIALETYVSRLADLIIDYASARLDDEPFSTCRRRARCNGCCVAGWERASKCAGRHVVLI